MTEEQLKKRIGTENPFRVPEGYFEGFTSGLMEHLPEKEQVAVNRTPTMWEKIRPLVYMAAMFVGAMLIIRIASTHYVPGQETTGNEEIDQEMEYINMAMETLIPSKRFLVNPTDLPISSASVRTMPSPGFGTSLIESEPAAPMPVAVIAARRTRRRIAIFSAETSGMMIWNSAMNLVKTRLSGSCRRSLTTSMRSFFRIVVWTMTSTTTKSE